MGQKVIYVDSDGKRFKAEITGPIESVQKHVYEKDSAGDLRIKTPGCVTLKDGVQKISGTTEKDNRVRPYVNLTVNFGSDVYPRYADVSGVRLKKDNDKNFNKGFYEIVEESKDATEEPSAPVEEKKSKKK